MPKYHFFALKKDTYMESMQRNAVNQGLPMFKDFCMEPLFILTLLSVESNVSNMSLCVSLEEFMDDCVP